MRIARIYFSDTIEFNKNILLPPHTSHYLIHVLRVKVGSGLVLFNGDGKEYFSTIVVIQKKQVVLRAVEATIKEVESHLKVNLAQAISKSEKMDWAMQKAVELGVDQITPIITDYCSLKLDKARMAKRIDHWQRIVISACEQSGRTRLPKLSQIVSFDTWIKNVPGQTKIFCEPGSNNRIKQLQLINDVVVLVGPEGGLSEREIMLARANGFKAISLGPRILRTETAALAVVAILQSHFGDI